MGGAEISMHQFCLDQEKQGKKVTVVFCDKIKSFGAHKHQMTFPKTWRKITFSFLIPFSFTRWIYIEYFLNKKKIEYFFKQLPTEDILYSYGYFAPAAINAYRGPCVYCIRDETGLGWNNNYYRGFKRFLRFCYSFSALPFYFYWKRDLKKCFKKAQVMANSEFIKREALQLTQNNVFVNLPKTSKKALMTSFKKLKKKPFVKGIVFIGNNFFKGVDVFYKLAKFFTEEHFYFFDRFFEKKKVVKNISYMPWEKEVVLVYQYAFLVLVPSRWFESYPRIIVEAKALGIDVLASNRGGISEALGGDENSLVSNVESIKEWKEKLSIKIKNSKKFS